MTDSTHCPLCTAELADALNLRVCSTCHDNLQLGGALPLTTTAEFAAMPNAQAARILAAPPGLHASEGGEEPQCSWCGKTRAQVKKVLSRGNTNLCNECVAFCVEILDMEFGAGWK